MKTLTLVLSFLLSISSVAAEFQLRYTDSTGLKWSQDLGDFSNGCLNDQGVYNSKYCTYEKNPDGTPLLINGLKQVKIADSHAEQACKEVSGRLPTVQEYITMTKDFEYNMGSTGWPILTAKGWKDLRDVFGDMVTNGGFGRCFWSSSILKSTDTKAYVFDSGEFGAGVFLQRDYQCKTRCVTR